MFDELVRGVEGLWREQLAVGLLGGGAAAAIRLAVPRAGQVLTPGLVTALCVALVLGTPAPAVAGAVAAGAEWRLPGQWATGLGPARFGCVLALLTALGWYAGLPDTEAALAAVGALAASLVFVPSMGWFALAASAVAVVVAGGAGRTGAVVGGLVCAASLFVSLWVVLPLPKRRPAGYAAALVLHSAVVVYAFRAVSRQTDSGRLMITLLPLAGLVAVLLLDSWRRRPGDAR